MKVTTLLTVAVALTALTTIHPSAAADPECTYRQIRKMPMHWANPTDCSRFYRCTNKNVKKEIACSGDREYNPKTGKCSNAGKGFCTLSLAAPLAGESNICSTEVSGAFLPQQGRCRDFFICMDSLAYPQYCDDGSMFDTKLATCVPDTGETCWQNYCLNQTSGTYLPDPTSCLTFYVCDSKNAVMQNCGSGSYFNRADGNCQPDANNDICWENFCLKQPDGAMIKNPADCTGYYLCKNEVATAQQCAEGEYFDWKSNSCEKGECPSDETTTHDCTETTTPIYCEDCTCPGGYKPGQMLPYPGNCQYYYICVNGALVQQSCGANNFFNETMEACDRDVYGVCPECSQIYRRAGRSVVEDLDKEAVMAALEPICLGLYYQHQMISHDECNKYQICVDGELHTKECGYGSYFNSEYQACIRDENNICKTSNNVQENVKETAGATLPEKFQENIPEVAQSDAVQNQSPPSTCCEEDKSGCTCPGGYQPGQMEPHPSDCDKFYVCQNGELILHECGEGNMFSSCDKTCVPDTNHVCWPKNSTCDIPNPDMCLGQANGLKLPNPNNCAAFYECVNGVPQAGTCGTDQWFNAAKGDCEVDVNAVCLNPCENIKGIVFLPHPDCKKFYFCNNGQAHIETCTTGGFDVKIGVCSPHATCESSICTNMPDGTTFPVSGDNFKFYVCISGVPSIRDCLDNTEYNEDLKVCMAAPSSNCDQNICKPGGVLGAFPTLNASANSFCYCRGDSAYETNCPLDYLFNSALGICYSNAPCDPEVCKNNPEYTVSVNRNDTHSFCLCVTKVPVIVDCPNDGTFYPQILRCRGNAVQDPNCNPTFCLDKPDYTPAPAINTNNGFCICQDGGSKYHSCLNNAIYNPEWGICLPGSFYCDVNECAKGANTIFPAFHDQYAFCYCPTTTHVELRNCPENSTFSPTHLACTPELCDSKQCLGVSYPSAPFPAIDYPYGYCLCQSNGQAVVHECPAGKIFDTTHLVCTDEVNTECNISLCEQPGKPYPYAIPAIDDPHKFCYCLSNKNVEIFPCPINKIYNPIFGVCLDENLPPIPDCDTCTCPGGYPAGSILPHRQYCNQYYVCSQGVLHLQNCGTGNFFNASARVCQPDQNGSCTDNPQQPCTCVGAYREGEMVANPNNRYTYYRCQNAQLRQETCLKGYHFSAEQNACVPETSSAYGFYKQRSVEPIADGPIAVNEDLLPCRSNTKRSVPSNCSQYDICQNRIWLRRSCSNQRYYNPEEQKCLEPRDDTICNYAKVSGLPRCNNQTDQQTLPHKNGTQECSLYYRCSRQKWRLKSCGENEYYSRILRTCVATTLSDVCEARNLSEIENYASTLGSLSLLKCRHTVIRAFSSDCAMYLMCLDGEWWYQYCPLGMYFNRTFNYCMPNDNGQCDAAALNRSCIDGERREFPLNCTAFMVCEGGSWQRRSCESNLTYDAVLAQCVQNRDGQCSVNGLRRACKSGEIRSWPIVENCTKFLYCETDGWIPGSCLRGHTFSVHLNTCVPHAPDDRCKALWNSTENLATLPSGEISESGEIIDEQSVELSTKLSRITDDDTCSNQDDGSSVAHPTDCTRFHICLHEKVISEQQCAVGSFFDPSTGYCRPNDGSCVLPLTGPCQDASDGDLLENIEDCRTYYHCSTLNGTEKISCPNGQYFNKELHQCSIDNGECRKQRRERKCTEMSEHGNRLPHERFCNIYYACVRGLAIAVQCLKGQRFDAALERCVVDDKEECLTGAVTIDNNGTDSKCSNRTDGIYLANLTDCTRYYICSNGQAQPKRCAAGAYFDSLELLCIPDDGACPFVGDEPQNKLPSPPDRKDCEGKHGNMLPDPLNCNEFYVCINGKLKHERCYTDYFFNTTINQCQAYGGVGGKQNISATYNGTETHSNGTATDNGSTKALTAELAAEAMKCADRPTNFSQLCTKMLESTSIAEQGDCRRFISCKDNEPISQRCRNGESYDSLLGFCRQNDGTCLLENGQRVGECNKLHGQLTRDAENCRGYFICINGQKISGECADNEYFDRTTNTCRKDDSHNQCSASPKKALTDESADVVVSCLGLSESVLYPYIYDDCRSYFQCVDGSPRVHECADGLYFDAATTSCIGEIRECEMPAIPATNSLLRAPEDIMDKDIMLKNRCESVAIGVPYANLDDHCRSYYVCESTESIAYFKCPQGTLYSTETHACASAAGVVCKI